MKDNRRAATDAIRGSTVCYAPEKLTDLGVSGQLMPAYEDVLNGAYQTLGISALSASGKYGHVEQILATIHAAQIPTGFAYPALGITVTVRPGGLGSVTGAITQALCKLGLEASVPNVFGKPPNPWGWVGDFWVLGNPVNLTVSVKSFAMRERSISSGSRSLLLPTALWCTANDAREFSLTRVESYKFAAFLGVYMPSTTLIAVAATSRAVTSLNGRELLRPLADFPIHLRAATSGRTPFPGSALLPLDITKF